MQPLPETQVSPEVLVPRLGDYLQEIGILLPEDLQRALDYQQTMLSQGKQVLLGQALIQLGLIDREILDQVITQQLISLHAALREANRQLEQRARQRSLDLERRLMQIRTTADVSQTAISAPDSNELLQQAVAIITHQLGYSHVSVFLADVTGQHVVIRETSELSGKLVDKREWEVGSQSIIGWVAAQRQTRVVTNRSESGSEEDDNLLPTTQSAAILPITIGEKLIGILDVQHNLPNAFDADTVVMLQTFANNIAAAIQNNRLRELHQISINDIKSLYLASHQLSQAKTADEVYQVVIQTLHQSSYISAVLRVGQYEMRVTDVNDPQGTHVIRASETILHRSTIPISPVEVENLMASGAPLYLTPTDPMLNIPQVLKSWLIDLDCKCLALIPITRSGKLDGLMIIGTCEGLELSSTALESYISLIELASSAIDKIYALKKMEKSLATLQTLNTISQVIAVEKDLNTLYHVVHNEVSRILGDVNFLIATYEPPKNMLNIPYLYAEGNEQLVDPTSLDEGLISVLLRTRQPVMIVEDVSNHAQELGVKFEGNAPKSWLGAPLLVGGEPIGAIIVQDYKKEYRFDEDDQQLLITLASQVAAAIHNNRLLEESQNRVAQERLIADIASQLRVSTDVDTILRTALLEIGRSMHASAGVIQLEVKN